MRVAVSAYTATSALGSGISSIQKSIDARTSGLRVNDFPDCDIKTWIGRVAGLETVTLPDHLQHLHSRNNQLAWLGIQQDGMLEAVKSLSDRIGASRIGVIMATSTSSIGRTEEAYSDMADGSEWSPEYCQPEVHNLHSPGIFVAAVTGVKGPSITISTACSSSAKVFASAARWIKHGVVDAVLVGGVDTLCLSVMYGFNSLELLSAQPCRPFDQRRDGISLGEAAGFALLTKENLAPDAGISMLGYGESSDAYHMSHPHPEGKGAILAIDQALENAGLKPADIDYINLHGTASVANDQIETRALAQRFAGLTAGGQTPGRQTPGRQTPGRQTLASSTKGWTGHTLGTAGLMEAVITMEAMKHGVAPGTLNCQQPDPTFDFPILLDNTAIEIKYAMSNSFGFGGNNATLIFGHNHD